MPSQSRTFKPRPKSKYSPVELVTASVKVVGKGIHTGVSFNDMVGVRTDGLAAVLLEKALQDESFAKVLVESSAV